MQTYFYYATYNHWELNGTVDTDSSGSVVYQSLRDYLKSILERDGVKNIDSSKIIIKALNKI